MAAAGDRVEEEELKLEPDLSVDLAGAGDRDDEDELVDEAQSQQTLQVPQTGGDHDAGPPSSSSAIASLAGTSGDLDTKKKPAASKKRRKRNMDDGDEAPSRRKKVSKACIYCKRSHMTCTENRPCDRCIKRDIAHLCSDTPVGEGGQSKARQSSASISGAHPPPSSGSGQNLEEPVQKKRRTSELASPLEAAQRPQISPASSASHLPSHQQESVHQQGSSTFSQDVSLLQRSPETTFNAAQLDYQGQEAQQHDQSTMQLADQTNHQQFNPFALLNQAYDYSYPSNNNNSSSNTLANLRLFASTADAQFGGLGNATNGFDLASLGLLNPNGGGQKTSDSGAGSDIDSNALDEFLRSLDEIYLNPMPDVPQKPPTPPPSSSANNEVPPHPNRASPVRANTLSQAMSAISQGKPIGAQTILNPPSRSLSPILGASGAGGQTSTERFLLTAADQKDGTRDERLNKVIRAKWEAGLLKPFNYIKGYERLNGWMEKKWQTSSKLRTLKILSEFRPAFRAIAQGLTDLDLIFIEEAFERLLLDCDRLFSTMGIPACLWRRTGEIFKGNREFAELVGVPYEQLRDGKLAIYEFMTEDSAVNFWEKYGSIAFDSGQKAVLTSCVLINQAKLRELADDAKGKRSNLVSGASTSGGAALSRDGTANPSIVASANVPLDAIPKEALIYCTFSFTIRRDAYHIPNAIVGNYMPYTPRSMR